jgi:hypothetical protein
MSAAGDLYEKRCAEISLQTVRISLIVVHCWMKGARNAPDKKRPHPPRMRETEGTRLKGRGCEILLRHEGLAPDRYPKARPRIGLFKRTYSCRTSDRSACPIPVRGPRVHDPGDSPWTASFPRVCAQSGSRPTGRANGAARVSQGRDPQSTRRQPFTCLKRLEEPKRRQKER